MQRNQELTNFISGENLNGKEYYAVGFDGKLVITDGVAIAGIVKDGEQNTGDVCVAVYEGEPYAWVAAKATVDIAKGDLLMTSAPLQLNGAGDNVTGLLTTWDRAVTGSGTIVSTVPVAVAMEDITADGTNNVAQLITIRIQ